MLNAGACNPLASTSGQTLWYLLDRIQALTFGPSAPNIISISPANIPFTITQPGYYQLIGDIDPSIIPAGADAITVQADNVTINLNQYAVSASTNSVVGIPKAINCGNHNNITVMNGRIRLNTSAGSPARTGIYFSGGANIRGFKLLNVIFTTGDNGDVKGLLVDVGASLIGAEVANVTFAGLNLGLAFMDGIQGVFNNSVFRDIRFQNIFDALTLDDSTNIIVQDCTVEGYSNIAYQVTGTSNNILFKGCAAIQGAAGSQGGFFADATTTNIQFLKCIATASAGAAYGFSTNSVTHFIHACQTIGATTGYTGVSTSLTFGTGAIATANYWESLGA